ncbi:MAG: glutamate dehydrogenase, partial [Candidatus Fimenecus sp.]
NDKLAKKMASAFNGVYSIAKEKQVTLRTGAYLIALRRVTEVLQFRGIWP